MSTEVGVGLAAPPHARGGVAVVTGGSSGIGLAIAQALAQEGYGIALVGQTPGRVEAALGQLPAPRGGSSHLGLVLDVSSEADMIRMADQTLERFGRIDLLVASAGIGKKPGSTRVLPHAAAELPLEEWRAVLGVNLDGVFLSNRAVLPAMRQQGAGHILNICSSTTPRGLRGTAFAPAYCASKFGVVGLTEALAEEVAGLGIRVQAVFPGAVQTTLVDQTTLARPFGGAVSAASFAAAVLELVRQPMDSVVVHPHIMYSRLPGAPSKSGESHAKLTRG